MPLNIIGLQDSSKSWEQTQLENVYPNVTIPMKPTGQMIIVQYPLERSMTRGIILASQSKKDHIHNQTVKVVAMSPYAFKYRKDGELCDFAEGPWYATGDFVRVPMHGIDISYYEPTKAEKDYINKISDDAKAMGNAPYIANEGMYLDKYIRYGAVFYDEVRTLIPNPLIIFNGH